MSNKNDDGDDDFSGSAPTENVVYMTPFDRAHPSTSIKSFHDEEDSGRNQGKRAIVTRAFMNFSPGSSAEVLVTAGLGDNLNLWRARVTELTNAGVLKKVDRRRCRLTNRVVDILQYVEPKDRVRRVRIEPRDEVLLQLCEALEGVIVENPILFAGQSERVAVLHEMIARGRRLAQAE